MKPREFLLYDKNDFVKYIFKVDITADNSNSLNGNLYEVYSWDSFTHEPCELIKLANLYMKKDGCTNWRVYNEDDRSDIDGELWHICGSEGLEQFEAMLAFVWKCAQVWMTKYVNIQDKDNDYKEFFNKHASALGDYKFVIRPGTDELKSLLEDRSKE